MIQRPDQRVAVFIDAQNLYHSAKHVHSAHVNFSSLVEAAVGSRQVIRAIAYVAKSKTGEENAFFEAMLQSGIELKIKDVQEFASGAKKADWDVGMAVDAISLSTKVDAVVLATGDGDFVPLVEYLKGHGVMCEVAAFSESTNQRLREVCDAFMDLSEEPETFLMGGKPKRKRASTTKKTTKTTKKSSKEDDSGEERKIRITF